MTARKSAIKTATEATATKTKSAAMQASPKTMKVTVVESVVKVARHTSELLLTVPEAARRLKLSERRMWTLVGRGDVRSIKISSSRRVPLSSLEEYVAARLQVAGQRRSA